MRRRPVLLLTVMTAALLMAASPAWADTTFTVNSTGDGGDQAPSGVCNTAPFPSGTEPECTLRAAIQEANATTAADIINFNIGGSGVKTISPATTFGLPSISEPVTIDGYTQPGASPNKHTSGNDAALKIELDGTNAGAGASGIASSTSNVVVKGLVINRFGGDGIVISGIENRIEGNFIGTEPEGTQDLGNGGDGVSIFDSTVHTAHTVGGTVPAARNVISGNGAHGVSIGRAQASGIRIEGNYIGTKKDGTSPLGNRGAGVDLVDSYDVTVGGATPGAANTIAFNYTDGVSLRTGFFGIETTGNNILSNSIFSNARLGIDLGEDGGTPNDPGDADTGPNNLQNFPVLNSAKTGRRATTIKGMLESTQSGAFTIQFFSNPAGADEGKKFIGKKSVTTDASGNVTFTFKTRKKLPKRQSITATATGPGGNTSEFSRPKKVRG